MVITIMLRHHFLSGNERTHTYVRIRVLYEHVYVHNIISTYVNVDHSMVITVILRHHFLSGNEHTHTYVPIGTYTCTYVRTNGT
jgi:hypothetical protein